MKKLFYLLALVAGSLAFTSCDDFQDEHNEFPWKPSATKLNTSDSRVGRMCTANGVITDNNAEAEGIIFAVDGNTAYLCAFTDLLDRNHRRRNPYGYDCGGYDPQIFRSKRLPRVLPSTLLHRQKCPCSRYRIQGKPGRMVPAFSSGTGSLGEIQEQNQRHLSGRTCSLR